MDEGRIFRDPAEERERLRRAIAAGFSTPLIDDVEDYVFEVVLCYMKQIPLVDPIATGRNKKLFDVVAPDGRGWSAKTLKWADANIRPGARFEFVIQRSDIVKKADELGFPGLTRNSPEATLGAALVEHWNRKFYKDAREQRVADPRIAILLKNPTRRRFAFIEAQYHPLEAAHYEWAWSRAGDGVGLKGYRDGIERFKWYPNQTQFFEVMDIPEEAFVFELEWRRQGLEEFLDRVLAR